MVADSSSLSRLVPGFDFLEGLVKNAGAAIPGMGQWVAPTIDPAGARQAGSRNCAPCSTGSSRTRACSARRSRRSRCSA